MQSVGIGWVNTLNAPPGTTGQIPGKLPANMKVFGDALRALLKGETRDGGYYTDAMLGYCITSC